MHARHYAPDDDSPYQYGTDARKLAGYYQVTVGNDTPLHTPDAREAYGKVAALLASGHLPTGTELRITFVSANRIEYPISLNWARQLATREGTE